VGAARQGQGEPGLLQYLGCLREVLCREIQPPLTMVTDSWATRVDCSSPPLLDVIDHLCLLVDGDPEFAGDFYAASTPIEMVELARESGILIDADDFRALLRSGSTEFWLVRGDERVNPITHLQKIFSV